MEQHREESFVWPSKAPCSSNWMSELSNALNPQTSSGNMLNCDISDFDLDSSKGLEANLLKTILNNTHPGAKDGQFVYTKLRKNPNLRKSLTSVNTARAYLYGTRAFGLKSWYKESFDVFKGLRTNEERRKFRFGLKSNVDFLIQLDVQNLKTCLQDTKFDPESILTQQNTRRLSNGSFLDTLHKVNAPRCSKLCTILNRISDNLKFTQSLSEYFANDDMLEPALMFVASALRKGPDLHKSLHGGSVASNAIIYRHRASPRDHDKKPSSYKTHAGTVGSQRTKRTNSEKGTRKFKLGFCFRFQHANVCNVSDCPYKHICDNCDSTEHGNTSCPET